MTSAAPTAKGPRLGADILGRHLDIIDLTRELFEGMPIYPFHQKPFITVNQTHEQSTKLFGAQLPFETHNLLISEHTGSHTDAIFEYDPDGPALDKTPLEYYYGPAIGLDVSTTRYPDILTAEVLQNSLDRHSLSIRTGDTVLLYTGHGDRTWPNHDYLHDYTGLNRSGAEFLAGQGVVNIGIDTVGIDHSDDATTVAHRVCKEFQIVNTEALTNLDRVAGKRFFYFGLPLKIRQGTGSPIRAIAVMNL
jgi:kynurenine formamidase